MAYVHLGWVHLLVAGWGGLSRGAISLLQAGAIHRAKGLDEGM